MAAHERVSLRNVYLYLVCLFTLVISIFAAVSIVRATVELLYPEPAYFGYESVAPDSGISEAEASRQEEAARDSQRRQSVLSLVGAGTTLLFAGPIYLYHWRRVQQELPVPPTSQPDPEPVP